MVKIKIGKIIKFLIIILVIFFLHFTKVLLPLESAVSRWLSPFSGQFYSWGSFVNRIYLEQTNKKNFNSLVKDLESRINFLTAENARLRLLEEENKELKEYLNFTKKNRFSYVLANIISYGELNKAEEARATIIIDRGEDEGVKKGLALINQEGIAVGKIISIKNHISAACLVTNPDCKFAAALLGKNKTIGVAEGELGLTSKIQFIPQTEDIKEGDTVITSGLEKEIPRGLVIGKVVKVDKASNELWQSAVVEPLANFNNLMIVSVLKTDE